MGGMPRNSVARLTDRARNDLNVLKSRKTEIKKIFLYLKRPILTIQITNTEFSFDAFFQ